MFDKLKDKVDDATDRISDTGITRKATSAATGKRIIDTEKLEDEFDKLERDLVSADVTREVAEDIVEETKQDVDGEKISIRDSVSDSIQSSLRDALTNVLSEYSIDFDKKIQDSTSPTTVLFAGINGVGKTTTIAKMASRYESMDKDVVIANGDTFRHGATEQIRQHSDNIGCKLITHEKGGDPTAVVYDAVEFAEANEFDVVLADTAGRLNTDKDLLQQLEKMDEITNPDYSVFVDQATTGQDVIERITKFDEVMDMDACVITKVDATEAGGSTVSIPKAAGIPIAYVCDGQGYDDIKHLNPREVAGQII